MEYQVPGPLSAASAKSIGILSTGSTNDIEIGANDFKGNTATWSVSGLKVLTGTQVVNQISGPSPFNPNAEAASITYQLSENVDKAEIYIFSITAELVYKETMTSGSEGTHVGYNKIAWNGRNNRNGIVSNGTYIYKIKVKDKIASGKIIVLAR